MIGSASRAEDEGGASLLAEAKVPVQPENKEIDYSSVITQVTKREPVVPPPIIQTFNLQHNVGGPGSPVPHQRAGASAAGASGRGSPRLDSSGGGGSSSSSSSSWRSKFRCLLCCFAPDGGQHGGYVKSRELLPNGTGSAAAPGANGPPPPYLQGGQGVVGPGGRLLGLGGVPLVPAAMRQRDSLIGPKRQEDAHKKTLVLDLDETLVHSSFKPIPSPDYIIPVEIDGKLVDVYVLKRPWLDHFMESIGHRYEVVVFTASLAKYADPLLDLLDEKTKVVRWRLFRDSCLPYEGNYVKDLACLGRELHDVIIVDNSPHSYVFQPANALPIGTFIDNMEDQELLDLLPVLQQTEFATDVRLALQEYARALGSQMQLAGRAG